MKLSRKILSVILSLCILSSAAVIGSFSAASAETASLLLVDSTTLRLFFSADSTYDSAAAALSYNGDTMTPGSEGNYILSNYSKSGTLGDVVTALYDYSVKSGACFG